MPSGRFGHVTDGPDGTVIKIPKNISYLVLELQRGRQVMALPDAELYYCAPTQRNEIGLVMPYAGISLLRKLRRKDHPSLLEIARHLSKGLALLHSYDIIHGDIKGANIVVDEVGIARFIDFWRPPARLLCDLSAPEERINGRPHTSKEVDCWRLGLMLQRCGLSTGYTHSDPTQRWTAEDAVRYL